MGTASMIGFYNAEDGSVTATYCHYDGYLSCNGKRLVNHYNTPELAEAVSQSGYLSSLELDLQDSLDGSVHKNEEYVTYDSVSEYLKIGADYACAEYLYLFDGEAWFFVSICGKEKAFEEVEMNLPS